MRKIRLVTKNYDYVGSTMVPPMAPMPEAIIWGSRIFIKILREDPDTYVEGMAWSADANGVFDETKEKDEKE